ncbi:translation factor GTPase family protein [Pseudoflavonifractor phocaeensis]|uniref:translation factor GTPase family protein n=1 Tax=Pseudoflavonifractor phocaeensis TaxID=1870988 RepID=UPI001F30B2FF|nr:TetM/TetW/TetO/TetS family tetracycline resistance ribosomal protection protein [Pseudoflavonifractor phocaeensis]MCF2596469.1 TetM/TetW/TetO/TetS family tetracycline resistance ribosomal protection protein [Pseudoflavonifractor phocaeensis]
MRRICIGVMAHVDAGKTTLSEGLLYESGALRRLGRVDHGDAFLDTDVLERERGITIFSKQALLTLGETEITLLDTPGHVDFSAEMERTLQVLDYAILVISGTDGVQSHTRTLWRLLARYRVPTFLFINKMDLAGADREGLLEQFRSQLDGGCVDFGGGPEVRDEGVAMESEEALERFLDTGTVPEEMTASLIRARKVFPCWFGSALKLDGVAEFLKGLETYTRQPEYPGKFGARVFKISRDSQNARLTWMKITGGVLKAKTVLTGGLGEDAWEEKADQLRLYSGTKFRPLDQAEAGMVVAVTGLTHTRPGQGLGGEAEAKGPVLEPVLNYQLILPQGADPHTVLPKLHQLEEEDPMLRVLWDPRWKEIHVQLMGQVQLEILRRLIADRFGLDVEFGTGSIVYKETIAEAVEGVGHFEPLRHYAEVHLLLEPGERGSGLRVASACSTDQLDLNWQRLILTHLLERDHPGVLTGSPITDMKIALVAGKAHLKHTEGGDFRQATYRAVRQGLMQARSVLLEPFYDFTLELPPDCVGRAMTDIQTMGGEVESPETQGELSVLTGRAPVAGLRDYWQEVTAYTRGMGRLSCALRGYEPCRDQEAAAAAIGYDPERDVDNPADSVFCAHGGGFNVKWDQVRQYMHVDSGLRLGEEEPEPTSPAGGRREYRGGSLEQDKELQAVFERTYGKVERQDFQPQKKPARTSLSDSYTIREQKTGPEYLLVDGYNIIFAWEELNEVARTDVAAARAMLEDILSNYQGFRKCVVILVFDAYKVKGNPGSVEKKNGIYVVYTKEAETADSYIEKATYDLSRDHRVRVATSDGLEQMIILGHGALRLSARAFKAEVEQTRGEIARLVADYNGRNRDLSKLKNTARVTKQ